MSNLSKYKNYQSLIKAPANITSIIYLSIIFVFGWIFFKFFVPILKRYFDTANVNLESEREEEEVEQVEDDIEVLENKYKPSYNATTYTSFANGIYNSVGYFYDDQTIVYSYLRRLKNDLDFLLLVKAFGKRKTGVYGFQEYRNMQEYLQYYYADHEGVIKQFNVILSTKGIKQRI